LRVFVDERGRGGNPLGVFLEGEEVPAMELQRVAAHLGFSETAFIEHAIPGEVRIFTPAVELPFAGHPLVGTAWLLRRSRGAVELLRPPAGEVPVRYDGERVWIAGRSEWCPPFEFVQLGSPREVEALSPAPEGSTGMTYVWSWEDEASGTVRTRCFVSELGIPEDEATGSAAIILSGTLGRELRIRQGRGSLLVARPLDEVLVEVGGLVEQVEVRELSL
jgi:predicted PhzF superfamily epimerase YddE/YHI9